MSSCLSIVAVEHKLVVKIILLIKQQLMIDREKYIGISHKRREEKRATNISGSPNVGYVHGKSRRPLIKISTKLQCV